MSDHVNGSIILTGPKDPRCSMSNDPSIAFGTNILVVKRLEECIWYLYGPWLMRSCCCSAFWCAVLHCLDVFLPACCGCMRSVLFAIGGIPMNCLNVFVADVLYFMIFAPLLESLCAVLYLV